MSDLFGSVYRGQSGATGGGNSNDKRVVMLNTLGEQIIMDWLQKAVLDGSCYHVRAGTITTPAAGDIEITDTDAEMCADAVLGTTIIPVRAQWDIEALVGTIPNWTGKSVAVVSNAGTAFTPLNMRSDGSAAVSTARVQETGAVQVPAELATTTRRHWDTLGTAIGGAELHRTLNLVPAPFLIGPRCFYIQISGVGTGPNYFASFEYVEYETSVVDR